MSKAIFKFNNGNGALLCNNCRVIIKVGNQYRFTKEAQYCDECKTISGTGANLNKTNMDPNNKTNDAAAELTAEIAETTNETVETTEETSNNTTEETPAVEN